MGKLIFTVSRTTALCFSRYESQKTHQFGDCHRLELKVEHITNMKFFVSNLKLIISHKNPHISRFWHVYKKAYKKVIDFGHSAENAVILHYVIKHRISGPL